MASKKLTDLLGDKAEFLLNHQSKTISKDHCIYLAQIS